MNIQLDMNCPKCQSNDTFELQAWSPIMFQIGRNFASEKWYLCSECQWQMTQSEFHDHLERQFNNQLDKWKETRGQTVFIRYYDPNELAIEQSKYHNRYNAKAHWYYHEIVFYPDRSEGGSSGIYKFGNKQDCDVFCRFAKLPSATDDAVWQDWKSEYEVFRQTEPKGDACKFALRRVKEEVEENHDDEIILRPMDVIERILNQ
jgi:hypothetical protein